MKTLTIKLSAPLQSYGNEATFSRRTSERYPSKSAVVGMLAAALGYKREDVRIGELAQLNFAVRVDQPGAMMTDYQTVEWKKDTRKVTYRDYIQDAVFLVALGSENGQKIEDLKIALKHPRFQPFLGRRANVPAGPLQVKVLDGCNPMTALEQSEWQAAEWYQKRHRKQKEYGATIIADSELLPDMRNQIVKDQVVSFSQRNRQYSFRSVVKTAVRLENKRYQKEQFATEHDVMDSL